MSLNLPQPILDYFAADRLSNGDAVAQCFSENATVQDEGRSHHGVSAIRRWKTESSLKYTYTVEPLSVVSQGKEVIVTSRLTGTFPGSPTNLRYIFALAADKIENLEIKP